MPVDARLRQPVGLRYASDRLADGQAAVDIGAIEMVACVARPHALIADHHTY
jgi:hypothetical protein